MCVCALQVTWRANGIALYMYEGKVLMDKGGVRGCKVAPKITHLNLKPVLQ